MDHTFPIGSTRHHHHSAGSSQQFSISGARFPTGGTRNSSSNNANNHSQQQQILNSVSSLFGSGVLPPTLFGRSGNSNNYLASNVAPNHFNFPLRSNTMNNRPGYGNGINPGGNGNYNPGGNGNYNPNRNRSTHSNQVSQPTASNVNKNRNPPHSSNGESTMNQQHSKVQSVETNQPQYRIFKRGESIPGISSPVTVITGGGNGTGTPEKVNSSSPNLNGNCSPEVEGSSTEGNSLGLQTKENNSKIGDAVDGNGNASKGLNQPNKTPVSLVSDIARFHGLTVEYRLVGEKGPPHSPTFTVAFHLGPNEEYVGQGSSIKRAQHAAASEALEKTGLSRPVPRTQPRPRPFGPGGKRPNWALIQLTSLVEDLKEPMSFIQQPVTIIDPFRRGDPPSVVSVRIGERIFTGEGSNFNAAKNMVAMIALKAMIKVKQEIELKKLAENGGVDGTDDDNVSLENKSPISVVHEMAMKRALTVKFEVTREEGPPHNKVFTVICAVGGDEITAEGQGPTKQAAKKAASELMIEKMNEIPLPSPTMELGSLKSIQRGLFRQKVARKKSSAPVVKDLEKQTVSPISRLIQIAHIKKYKEPEFNLVASSTSGLLADELPILKTMSERDRRNIRKKKPSFTMEVVVGTTSSRGTGPNKKAAKKAAAESALIELGYGPSEPAKEPGANISGANDKLLSGNKQASSNNMKFSKTETGKSVTNGGGTITSARQIVPGILVLSSERNEQGGGSPTASSAVAQEMIKVNSLPATTCGSAFRDGTEKLAYLARLLDVPVSYSDFPKKNEFLSVVSLGTNPPHVAHGCGASLDEAQNTAALKILEELSDMGLDSVKSNEDVSTS